MSYIRTKDGIYTLITKDAPIYELNGKKYYCVEEQISSFSEDNVIAQADTIEELCDGFWWENTMYKEPIFIPNYGLVLDRIKAWKESDKELNDNSFDRIIIYGSIYIHGYGWKHVCKVNKNEERLELL